MLACPPPGAGLLTPTVRVAANTINGWGTWIMNCVEVNGLDGSNTAATPLIVNWLNEPKPVPVTVRFWAAVPAEICVGVMLVMFTGGYCSVTADFAVAPGFCDVASTSTNPLGPVDGGVYNPSLLIVPTAAFPPAIWFTDQA